jgi:hypothetical protein
MPRRKVLAVLVAALVTIAIGPAPVAVGARVNQRSGSVIVARR